MAVTGHAVLLATDVGRRPRAGRTIHRPRVQALLETSIHARLVLVAAPAGYGKSTLLVSWLEGAPIRAGWLSLDPHDDDAVRFARALEATAELIHASTGEPAASDPARPVDLDLALGSVLQQLADAVAGGPSGGVALVLDDYHVISQPAIHRFVGDLVARLPPGVRLVLATRSDPPLPLARLRARGELVEIRAADLRFSEEEADALLRAAGVELLQGEVAELAERTEGWAAALRLAAVALREGTDRSARVHRFGASHRFVLDYIVEEVLAGLSSESQAFLLRTSILERLCGPLCDTVTGAADGQRLLETFERLNLLTVPLDDERRWFRYHALFAEVLRARLGALHPDEVLELHARAAAWYASQADDDGAVFHVLRSGDTERACQVLADASLRRLNAGDLSTVRRWLDALPAESVRAHPQLSLSYAWCLALAGETDGVAERLADAERAVAQDAGDADAGVLRTQAALLRSRLADLQGDPQAAAEHARLALDLLPSGLPLVAEATLRGDATVLLARALVAAGDARGAAAAYLASLPDLRAGGNAFAAGRAVADLAALDIERGDPMSAARRCEAEIARSRTEPPGAVAGSVWAALARARLALRQVDLAEAAALQGLAVATRTGDAQVARSVERTLERVAVARTPAGSRVQGRSRAGRPGLEEPLTPRETEVLALVALGRSNSQIAGELFVSVGTVKSHLHTISGKLAAANRVEAVARARALGLLP